MDLDTVTINSFDDLVRETRAFFRRFLGGPPTPAQQNPRIDEELRELRQEIFTDFEDGCHDQRADIDTGRTAEEGVDVIVTVLGLLDAVGVTPDQLDAQMAYVAAKLRRKDFSTHRINLDTGKIERRNL